MIIQTIYIWIIWIILKIPNLEIKETQEVLLKDDTFISQSKYSLFYQFIDEYKQINYSKFRISLLYNYQIIDNQTIIQYDKEQIRIIQNNNDIQCFINRTHEYINEFLLSFKMIDQNLCNFQYYQQQQRLNNNELLFTRKYDNFKIINQYNHFIDRKLIIVAYQTQIKRGILILEQILDSDDLLLLHEYSISLKEYQNLNTLYAAHSINKFVLIINAKLLLFKQGQIQFYKIDQIDELQFSIDGNHLYALSKSIIYFIKLNQPKVYLIELKEQSNKFKNAGILSFKCLDDGMLILTQQGELRHLEIKLDQTVHKITVYDGMGPLLTRRQISPNRQSKNVQMQTFNYSTQEEKLEDVPQTTKQFLRYTNGIEAYLNTFPSFNPDHWTIFSWRLFICSIVILYFYLIPVLMFFGYEIISENLKIEPIVVFLSLMISFLLLDVFITLNTGYYDKGQLVLDKHSIFVRYVTQEFLFDIIAVVALILQVTFRDLYAFLVWVPYLFYFKYYYVTIVDQQVEQLLQVQRKLRAFYQILKLILTILFLVNLFACIFYAAGDYWINQKQDYSSWLISSGLQNNIYDLPLAVKYEYSFYWALTTMLTVGYGDVTGKNPLEIFVSIITMIFACVMFAMIVSAFQNVFSEITHHNMQFDKKMTDINRFMKDKNIDTETQQKVRRFFSFIYSEKVRDFNEQIQIINQLGPQLKDEVIRQSYGLIFKRTYWTNTFSYDFQKKLVYLISEQMYCDGEIIFKQNLFSMNGNNDDDCLYCVSIGHVLLYLQFDDQDMVFNEAEQDSIFGELGFLTGYSRTLSAKSVTISQLYKLKRSEFIQLLNQFPLDFQYFCQLRDQIQFGQYNLINLSCFCCQSNFHLATDCPKSHYYPSKVALVNRVMSQKNKRQKFQRSLIRRDNLNLLKIQKAQQLVKQELSITQELEELEQMNLSFSIHDTHSQISEQDLNQEFDIVNEIVQRLESKKKQGLIEIDTKCSFKNYYPQFNVDHIIQHFRKERRFTRAFTKIV